MPTASSRPTVPFSGCRTPETLLGSYLTIADLLGLPASNEADQRNSEKAVHRWLQTHTGWLLIYDNVEWLTQRLPVARDGAILLTTRAQATGNVFFPLKLDVMTSDEATRFLLRRSRLADPFTEQLDPQVHTQAETLADSLGRLPLALDQAGAFVEENGYSLETYLALSRRHRQFLLRQRGSFGMDHPASVATTFQQTFEQVRQQHPDAADLLRFCAYLSPEAIPEELFWQAAAPPDAVGPALVSDELTLQMLLKDLLRASLIQRHPDTRTISLHCLVQEVLQDEMDQQTRRRWIERVIHRLTQLFPARAERLEDWPVCERLLPHVLACVHWSKQTQATSASVVSLCSKVVRYVLARGQYPLAIRKELEICIQVLGPEHLNPTESFQSLDILKDEEALVSV